MSEWISTICIREQSLTKIFSDGLKKYEKDLEGQIKEKRDKLLEIAERGNVEFEKPNLVRKTDESDQSPQPSFNSQSLEQYRTTKDHLMQTEFQIMELEARYSARQAEEQQQALASSDNPGPWITKSYANESARNSSVTRKLPP